MHYKSFACLVAMEFLLPSQQRQIFVTLLTEAQWIDFLHKDPLGQLQWLTYLVTLEFLLAWQ